MEETRVCTTENVLKLASLQFGKLLPTARGLSKGFINETDPWLQYKLLKSLLSGVCGERGLVFERNKDGAPDGGGGDEQAYPEKSPLRGDELADALGELLTLCRCDASCVIIRNVSP